jgi:hypothetical protein
MEGNTRHSLGLCKVSGMIINAQKSIILHSNVNIDSLKSITDVFTYLSKDLELGFHYLGYYLKLDNYRAMDWSWLIEKFMAQINHWGNNLLSLGGRLVLLKAVMETQPVYWLVLVHIPISFLNTIRKICFSFLWSGVKNKKKFHLCTWISIARPKSFGGWGLQNIFLFSRSLETNTML